MSLCQLCLCQTNNTTESNKHILKMLVYKCVCVSGQDDGVGLPAGSDAILSSPYVDSFSCEGQAYGYFADVQNNCEASDYNLLLP